ncbi:hypothetical protein [Wukongibacter sp. M2B1]|uniref:hypothetical protein n=1 Tax=Wukongibacter sp. M2B1 TaxID=3088895 RepID=UPI003D796338
MKRFFTISLLVAMCLSLTVDVFAEKASKDNQDIKIENLKIKRSMSSKGYFSDWGNSINYRGDGELEIGGYTESYDDIKKVYVKVYLQKYDTSTKNWENVNTIYSSKSDTDYVRVKKALTVKEGYKYRVYSIHKATIGSTTKKETSKSESIYAK